MVDLLEFGKKSTWIDLVSSLVMPLIHHKGKALISIETIKNKLAEELSVDDIDFIREVFKLKGIETTPFIDAEDSNPKKDYLEFTKIKEVK